MDCNTSFDQRCGDLCLKVRKRQNQIGIERKDLRDIRRREGRHTRLLATYLPRPHRISRYADDPILLAEKIERLDSLFGQADNPLRWEPAHVRHVLRRDSQAGAREAR